MIGIIAAMDEELERLLERTDEREREEAFGCTFITGTLAGRDVVLVRSGIGKVNAAVAATLLIERFTCTHVLMTGVAGSARADISIGDIVIATELVQHDVDATAFGYAAGQLPGMPERYATDEPLRSIAVGEARRLGARVHEGVIATGDEFVSDPPTLRAITDAFDASAVEMESAAVGQVCSLANVPLLVVRAISDTADSNAATDFEAFLATSAPLAAALIEAVVARI